MVNGQLQYATGNWTIKNLNINFVIKQLAVEFEGMEHMGDFLNEMRSAIGPEVLDILWPNIEPLAVEMATKVFDQRGCFVKTPIFFFICR